MRRIATVLAMTLVVATAYGHDDFSNNGPDCDGRNFRWNDRAAFVEKQTIDASTLRSLELSVENAPVSVRGGSPAGYSIEVCKAAAIASDLPLIRVTFTGGQLEAQGPKGHEWQVAYMIRAPRGADINLTTENGPLAFRDVEGTISARATNGPLALNGVSGLVDAQSVNGPISVRGGSGTMKVRASNGPLSIHLSGSSWVGGTLDAATENGPVTLKLPRGYGSGVVVETNGRGPVSCKAEGCENATPAGADRWSNEPRRFELGRGAQAVHIETNNGPLTIKNE
jgi:hypothetical protein